MLMKLSVFKVTRQLIKYPDGAEMIEPSYQ
jgi:hypothetical protein